MSLPTNPFARNYAEQHYTPQQLAKLWGVSQQTIRVLFENEPGVFIVKRPETRKKRRYSTMRIPASVAAQVHARYTKRAKP